MAKRIPISQNPERYNQIDKDWQISASPNIPSVLLQRGQVLDNVVSTPDLKVDGVIIKVVDGETVTHLISPQTQAVLTNSQNPHYSIESSGTIEVKGKPVGMGNSVKVISISIDKLKERAEELDQQNRKAGVGFVDYVYEGDNAEGTSIPLNLLKQINYTLKPDMSRPEDRFGINLLDLGDADKIYNITQLNTQTRQSDGTLDKSKLETALKELNARLAIMGEDFNMIKDVFYNGTFPESKLTSDFVQVAKTVSGEDEFPTVFKYSRIVAVEPTPNTTPPASGGSGDTTTGGGTPTGGGEGTPPPSGQPATTTPPVIQLRLRKKRGPGKNNIPVYEGDPTAGAKGARKRVIKEGNTFWGYFHKDWEHGQKIWAVYEADKTTLVGWGVADRNDYCDPV
jgi:hypothetical protein